MVMMVVVMMVWLGVVQQPFPLALGRRWRRGGGAAMVPWPLRRRDEGGGLVELRFPLLSDLCRQEGRTVSDWRAWSAG